MRMLRTVLLLLSVAAAIVATPSNLKIENSVPAYPGDTLTWAYGSDEDSVWSLIAFDNGDGVCDSTRDPIFHRLMQVDNGTESQWFDDWGIFPDADTRNDSFLYVIPKGELAPGLYWMIIKDNDGIVVDSFRYAEDKIYRTISGKIIADSAKHAAFTMVSAHANRDGNERTSAISDSNGNFTLFIDTALGLADSGNIIVRVDRDGARRLPLGFVPQPSETLVNVKTGNITAINFKLVKLTSGIRITAKAGGIAIPNFDVGINDSGSYGNWLAESRTNDSGVAIIYCAPGTYRIQYSRDRLPPNALTINDPYIRVVTDNIAAAELNFPLGDTAIYGRVTKDGAAPGGTYKVRLYDDKTNIGSNAVSDANGYFRLPALSTDSTWFGMIEIWDKAYDSIPAGYVIDGGSNSKEVKLGDSLMFNFIPRPSGAISGNISNDSRYTPSEFEISLAAYDSTTNQPGNTEYWFHFKSTGSFICDGVKPGKYMVRAMLGEGSNPTNWKLEKWVRDTSGERRIFTVTSDTIKSIDINFTDDDSISPPDPSTKIAGWVINTSSFKMTDVSVRLEKLDSTYTNIRSVSDSGAFDFNGFPPASYHVSAYVDTNGDGKLEAASIDTIVNVTEKNTIYLMLYLNDMRYGTVNGRLTQDSGAAINFSKAMIELQDQVYGRKPFHANANGGGSFQFQDVPEGSYKIRAFVDADTNGIPEYTGETFSFMVTTTLPADSVMVRMVPMAKPERTISGSITYTDPWPSTGLLYVTAESKGMLRFTRTFVFNATGSYLLDSLYPGEYTISAWADSQGTEVSQRIRFAEGALIHPAPSGPIPAIVSTLDSSRTGIHFSIMKNKVVGKGIISGQITYKSSWPTSSTARISVYAVPLDSGEVPSDSVIFRNISRASLIRLKNPGTFTFINLLPGDYLIVSNADTLFSTTPDSFFQTFADGAFGTVLNNQFVYTPVASKNDSMPGVDIELRPLIPTSTETSEALPAELALRNPYPNPFNPTTTIAFDVPRASHVTLVIYDMSGRQIKTLVNSMRSAGFNKVIWNAKSDQGTSVATGIYVCRMQSGKFVTQRRLILLK
ncbi:MAG: T9SS type A sorting domain-containing protein [Fibrobacteres bacterium]|nr:T9SS type A sorting domain-containing protein [Fibrobacterota bacterium]